MSTVPIDLCQPFLAKSNLNPQSEMLEMALLTLTKPYGSAHPRSIHVPLIQASINRKRTRFELNAELSSLETCTAYGTTKATKVEKIAEIPESVHAGRKPLTDSTVNLSTAVVILSDDYQPRST